jgi:hypothetical protein
MIGLTRISHWTARGARTAALVCALAALTACTDTARFGGSQPDEATANPPAPTAPAPPTPPQPPPVDLAGRWKLSADGSTCLMTFDNVPGANQGKIAPAGGCPGDFFTSRKWTYEHEALIIHDYKGETLVELSFGDGHFAGQDGRGGAITLARP